MRIQVVGDSPVVDELIGLLRLGGYAASRTDGTYSFHIDELKIPLCTTCRSAKSPIDYVIIDGVDCELEQLATNYIQELGVPKIVLDRAGNNKSDKRLEVKTPNIYTDAVSLGLYRAIDKMLNKSSEPSPEVVSIKKRRFFGLLAALVLVANTSLYAQDQNSIIRFWNPTLDAIVAAGDVANNALRVNMVAGTISGADGAILDGVTSSIKATVFDYTNSNPLAVRLTDTNGDFIAGGASDPTFTDATGSTVPANAAFVAGTDGTNTRALKTDAGGELQVDVLTMPTVTVTATNLDVQIGGSDSLTIGTFPDNVPINNAQVSGTAISVNDGESDAGSQRVVVASNQQTSATNDGSCVSVTATTTVLASLATRKAFTLFARETNTAVVHIKMGATATTSNFPIPPGGAMNMPFGNIVYTGVIDAIAASGTQSVCVMEF